MQWDQQREGAFGGMQGSCPGQVAGSTAENWQELRHRSSSPKSVSPPHRVTQPMQPICLICLFMCLFFALMLCLMALVCCLSFCLSVVSHFCVCGWPLFVFQPSLSTHPAVPFSLLSLPVVQNSTPGYPTCLPS